MANIKSAIKRIKKNEARRLRNKAMKSTMRTAVKKVEVAVTNNNSAEAKEALVAAVRKIDKAASKGVIHKNAANRYKSRLYKKVNSLNA
ncbi:30S ribosomal protein S20 [Fervidibacillus halotolerans]|uniref:Small ribosomal subunit protein bS20 n=1 Tax=Fervidibacillus halotolerans TaxID=2980027 RepID=A0A9E8LYV9_9BACI|nr:30S ribosomal protein S20 [Fervidibacillus halotolerans]WAA11516.1 30S ribosomal protein S20 [Fervidibacillus halotolerans]